MRIGNRCARLRINKLEFDWIFDGMVNERRFQNLRQLKVSNYSTQLKEGNVETYS